MDYFSWSIDPIIFSFGAITIRWYGLFFSTGFIVGYYTMRWIYNAENINCNNLDRLLWYLIAGTLIGARLVHCIFYEPAYYLENPVKILAFWEGGLASHGGTAGVLFSLYLYQRTVEESYLWLLDRLSIPIAVTAFSIRIGNFFNSEIIGTPTTVPWAVIFQKVDLIARHPAQLYEAFSYLCTFLVLFYLYKKTTIRHKHGAMLGILLISVFLLRFLIEFIKVNQENYETVLFLNTGQLLSIPFIIFGLVLLNFSLRNKTNRSTI